MALFRMLKQNFSVLLSILLGLFMSYLVTLNLNDNCEDLSYIEPRSVNDEYKPLINIAGKPQRAKKVPKNLVRPRYYSTELGIKQKIFMGVMTSEKTVRNLALAVNRTSLPYLNKIMFFLDAIGAENVKASDLKLPGIIGFKDTKEVLRPFHVIKYLTDNFLDEYDFFFISKDTTYVNGKELELLVHKISVSRHIHAGGMLNSESSEFCSLDGGILLSNSVLKKLQATLDWCVKNSFSDSHDANVGRCILHASQLPCVQTIDGYTMESIMLKSEDNDNNLDNLVKKSALTYYPITDPDIFYKLHLMFCKKRILQMRNELDMLEKNFDKKNSPWPPGSHSGKVPPTRFDLLSWQLFDINNIYLPSDFQNYKPLIGLDRQDIMNVLNKSVEWTMNRYSDLHYRRLVNGYKRFDASRGLDYILDLSFKDNFGREIIKRIEVSKPLGKVEMLPMPYVTENARIFILLPLLSDNKNQASIFMRKYSQTCSQTELTFLIIILLYEPKAPGKGHESDVFKEIKTLATDLSAKKHRDCKITWISIRLPEVEQKAPLEDHLTYFAITDLASKKLTPESLIMYGEPNMEIRTDYFNRVRMGTITKKQIYSPIPFTEYSPEIIYRNISLRNPVLEIHKNSGRFDTKNNRHVSFYLNDYLTARMNYTTYLPVVKQDKDITRLFTNYKESKENNKVTSLLDLFSRHNINVLRTTEPSLRLSRPECTPANDIVRSTEFRRCSSPMGTRSQLGQIVLDYKDKLRQM